MKKVLIYDPYLDTLGGGERHLLQIAEGFRQQGYSVAISWSDNLQTQIQNRFGIDTANFEWVANIASFNIIKRFLFTLKYDAFLYVSDGSYILSGAKKNFIFCMVPNKELFKFNLISKLKVLNAKFICNSKFTCEFLKSIKIEAKVIYPYLVATTPNTKKNIGTKVNFINVGRFFESLHSKRQDVCLAWFVEFVTKNPNFAQSTITCVGGLNRQDQVYFDALQKFAQNFTGIKIVANATNAELNVLYSNADVYLHFAGFGVDEKKTPQNVEHLGITPLEAMQRGILVCAYNVGGIKETVIDGFNGIAFLSFEELTLKLKNLLQNPEKLQNIILNGKKFVDTKFSREELFKNVKSLL